MLSTSGGCHVVMDAVTDSIFGTDTDYTYRLDHRHTQKPETRRWVIHYHEQLRLTSELPGVIVKINGQTTDPCPAVISLPPQPVDIVETGFYPAHEIYRLTFEKQEHGPDRFVSEDYLRTERAPGPTRWAGHRTVTADLPPLTVTWMQDGRLLGTTDIEPANTAFTLKTAPDDIDPVLLTALRQLEWNRPVTDPRVPTQAHGHRHLHWPPPPPPPEVSPEPKSPSDQPEP